MQPQQSEITPIAISSANSFTGDMVKITILLFTAAVLLFVNIGGWDLWNPDEPRYAQVAREMLQTRNFLVPHINSEIYPDKPPLFFWFIAFFSKPFGDVSAASARIPSALAALGVILLTYLLGKKLYNSAAGFISGLILITTTQFFWLALRANIDMTLTFWTTLAIFLFYCGYTKNQEKRTWYLLAYFFMGLAVLTKGPVGFFIPFITISLFLIVNGQYKKLKEIEFTKGILIFFGIVLFWLVPTCITAGKEYAYDILIKHTVARTIDSWSHKQPVYYYLINFPADFNPWTFFIPSAVICFWKKWNQGRTLDISLPLVWFAGTFIFFSFISGKRNLYLLPLYPAAALLMAKFWCDFISLKQTTDQEQPSKLLTIPMFLLFAGITLFCIVFGAALIFGGKTLVMKQFEIDLINVSLYSMLIIFCTGGITGLMLLRNKARAVLPFVLIVLLMAGGFLFSVVSLFPSLNVFKSGKPFCDRIAKIVKPTDKLVTFRFKPESFNYFLNRSPIPVIDEYADLKKLFSSPEKIYCLIHAEYEKYVPNEDNKIFTILDKTQIGRRKYYLLVNNPAEK